MTKSSTSDYKNLTYTNGYVFYERLKNSELNKWNSLYAPRLSEFYQLNTPYMAEKNVGSYLLILAKTEREKELDLLKNIFGVRIDSFVKKDDYTGIIRSLNEVLNVKESFSNILNMAKMNATKGEFKRGNALGAFTDSKISSILYNSIKDFVDENIKDGQFDFQSNKFNLESKLNSELEKMSRDAFDEILNQKDLNGQEYLKAQAKFIKNTALGKQLKEDISKQIIKIYHLPEVISNIIEDIEQKQDLLKVLKKTGKMSEKSGLGKLIKVEIGTNKENAQKGGLLSEYFETINTNTVLNSNGKKGTHRVIKSNIPTTDSIMLLNVKMSIQKEYFNSLNKIAPKNKTEAIDELEKIYNKSLAKINDGFIIYESDKNYSLSDNFDGFTGRSNVKLSDIQNILNISYDNIFEFMTKVANTIPGAIGQNYKKEVDRELSTTIATHVADLLFDGYSTLGRNIAGGAKQLHVFRLSGIIVPLSYLLRNLGEALSQFDPEQADNFMKINVYRPNIMYEDVQVGGSFSDIIEKWNIQRESIYSSIKVSIKFLSNFKKLLNEI